MTYQYSNIDARSPQSLSRWNKKVEKFNLVSTKVKTFNVKARRIEHSILGWSQDESTVQLYTGKNERSASTKFSPLGKAHIISFY